jgi:hypothetical protein
MKHPAILFMIISPGLARGVQVDREADERVPHEATMTARGTFDVKVTPQPTDDPAAGPFGRLFLDKRFDGDLEGVSRGQMLAAETGVAGSAAYVAFELVNGTLHGKKGSFILQHKEPCVRATTRWTSPSSPTPEPANCSASAAR